MPESTRVTVCLPTFNRVDALERAARSVLEQSFDGLELVIGDNASTDATPELCAQLARDTRVQIYRNDENIGLTANFNGLLRRAQREFVMVLADDDWIGPEYLERCIAAHDEQLDHVLVSGSARYHRNGRLRGPGVDVDCGQDDPVRRVRWYFAHVADNASIYGVIRRSNLEPALPMANALAGDWMLVGRLLMDGKLRTIPDALLHRSVGGTSASLKHTARSMGLSSREEHHPTLAMAHMIYRDIAFDAPAYAALGPRARRGLGIACAAAVLRSRGLDVIDDELGAFLRRPRMRRLDALARRVAGRDGDEHPYLP